MFQTWLIRTIQEGVNLGYRGSPRDHLPQYRKRPLEEITQLEAQYSHECQLGRIVCAGVAVPYGELFPKFFVSPTYTIPKKRKIGQPQKWRLIHNLSGHNRGKALSINAGISNFEFPVTYPSVNTACHRIFCEAQRGCVLWGRDLKEYYRHLLINPYCWWSTGTKFAGKYYFDCYCPFGARSMPAVFQRLSDAIRVIMLRRTPVDALLGMLDDFLGVTYRLAGESDEALFRRGRAAEQAFDLELSKMGISKQATKDSPTDWTIVWMGVKFDTRDNSIQIPEDKVENTRALFQTKIFEVEGRVKRLLSTKIIDEIVGILCHFSQTWPRGKTLLWPLYMLLSEYRGTWQGKPKLLDAQVTLDEDCKESLLLWYDSLTARGLRQVFYTCKGQNTVTILECWWTRLANKHKHSKARYGVRKQRLVGDISGTLCLKTPWENYEEPIGHRALAPRSTMIRVVQSSIHLLYRFLLAYLHRCGDVIEIRTNVARFQRYITKKCYPKNLDRNAYKVSLKIHQLLETQRTETNRPPRELKAFFIS